MAKSRPRSGQAWRPGSGKARDALVLKAAVKLQACLRRSASEKRFLAEKAARAEAVVALQAHWRGTQARATRGAYEANLDRAASTIAAHRRGQLTRREEAERRLRVIAMAVRLQAKFRMLLARRGYMHDGLQQQRLPRTPSAVHFMVGNGAVRSSTPHRMHNRQRTLTAREAKVAELLAPPPTSYEQQRPLNASAAEQFFRDLDRFYAPGSMPATPNQRRLGTATSDSRRLAPAHSLDSLNPVAMPLGGLGSHPHASGRPSHLGTPTSLASRSGSRLGISPSRQSLTFSDAPSCLFGPPRPLRLLKRSSVALLRSEMARARALTEKEHERARHCNLLVATERMVEGIRREAHHNNMRRTGMFQERDATAAQRSLEIASAWEGEMKLWHARGTAAGRLVRGSRGPVLSICRTPDMPRELFAHSSTPSRPKSRR